MLTAVLSACALFLNVTLTTWTIGNVVPIHTRECYSEFGLGLAINTMQGREAKHLRLREYTKKTTVLNRWNMAFRHEYMSTIWLNENDPSCSNIKMSVEEFTQKEFQNHIPKIFTNSEVYCYCGITKTDGNCAYCTHPLNRADIESSCKEGKIEQALKMWRGETSVRNYIFDSQHVTLSKSQVKIDKQFPGSI